MLETKSFCFKLDEHNVPTHQNRAKKARHKGLVQQDFFLLMVFSVKFRQSRTCSVVWLAEMKVAAQGVGPAGLVPYLKTGQRNPPPGAQFWIRVPWIASRTSMLFLALSEHKTRVFSGTGGPSAAPSVDPGTQ